jgi:hypothetical protein
MITRELLRHFLASAPLPHTAGEDAMGRAPIVASNGRLLGWAASRSVEWKAVAQMWAKAPETILALYKTIDGLYERIGKTDDERDQMAFALRYAADDAAKYRTALEAIDAFTESPDWEHGSDSDESGSWVTCEGRWRVQAMVRDVLA